MSNIQVLVTRNFHGGSYTYIDITQYVEQATWKGSKYGAPRSLDVDLTVASSQSFKPTDEDYLFLKINGKEYFRGKVFKYGFKNGKKVTMTAYDNMIYLTKNKDTYVFKNKTASQIISKICSDFSIPVGSIASTSYTIKNSVHDNESLYDIMMKVLDTTRKATGTSYYIYSQGGKIYVIKRSQATRLWEIDENSNLIDYDYSVSMENTYTKVKLESGQAKEKGSRVAIASNSDLMKKFGVLQYYENVGEDLKQSQLQARANQMMKNLGKVEKSFTLNALGIPDVISGGAVYVKISELGIKKAYYIDEDTHVFKGNTHTMSLKLTETDELPELNN